MRLWTVHPRYLDAKGLVAAWREALLAQKVLQGGTRGYKHHPQLVRFRTHPQPVHAIAAFLCGIVEESDRRGYEFDRTKISRPRLRTQLKETRGQLDYEWKHLRAKLRKRAPAVLRRFTGITRPQPHPLFRIVAGPIRDWERTGMLHRLSPGEIGRRPGLSLAPPSAS